MNLDTTVDKKCDSAKILLDCCFENQRKRFKVKKRQYLEKLFKIYCDQIGKPRSIFSFYYNGKRISEFDTAESTNMREKDTIIAYVGEIEEDLCDAASIVSVVQNAPNIEGQEQSASILPDQAHASNEELQQKSIENTYKMPIRTEMIEEPNSPTPNMCDNSATESNEAKILRLEPIVNKFLLSFKCHEGYNTSSMNAEMVGLKVEVQPAPKQRNCANCGGRSRFCTTYAYCNSQCRDKFVEKQYEKIHPKNQGP